MTKLRKSVSLFLVLFMQVGLPARAEDSERIRLHPQVASFLRELNKQRAPRWEEMTPSEGRKAFSELTDLFGKRPNVASCEDRMAGDVPIRVYWPEGDGPFPTVMYFHGGGWVLGDLELRLSYQVEGFNSGVQYRSVDDGDWVVSGYQCDFEARWHASEKDSNAALVDKFSGMFFEENGRLFMGQRGDAVIVLNDPKNSDKPTIEKIASLGNPVELESHIKRDGWNELIVIANENQFTHIINERVMAIGIDEDKQHRRASGLFAFQLHEGPPMKIQVKDIRVRELPVRAN